MPFAGRTPGWQGVGDTAAQVGLGYQEAGGGRLHLHRWAAATGNGCALLGTGDRRRGVESASWAVM